MMRPFFLAAVALYAAAALPAQAGLTAEQVIEKSIEAAGGRPAIGKLTSTYVKGTMMFSAQEMHGMVEIYAKAPNKQLVVTNLEGVGEIKQGFDGQAAWAEDPTGQVTEITGAALADLKRSSTFNASLKWREMYPTVELAGEETVDGHQAYVVKLTTASGKVTTRYYDSRTFLLLRESGKHDTPSGPMEVTLDYSDYRDVDGIKVPFEIKQQLPPPVGEIIIRVSEAKNNIAVENSKFSKPVK
jgi:zinc protease